MTNYEIIKDIPIEIMSKVLVTLMNDGDLECLTDCIDDILQSKCSKCTMNKLVNCENGECYFLNNQESLGLEWLNSTDNTRITEFLRGIING